MSKVDRNQSTIPVVTQRHPKGGIPLRLEIASMLLAGAISRPNFQINNNRCIELFLIADALIAAHNETCGEE